MKKKIVGLLVCMLMIAPLILPVSGKITVSTDIDKNLNEYFLLENENYPLLNELDEFIIKVMLEKNIPGLSATIVKNDSIFWTKSYGYANVSSDLLVKNTTLFKLASISKTIVATAIMQLYEQGIFSLDDPINEYLPFQVNNPDYASTNITFHMLLTHTSSIEDNWGYMPIIPGDPTIPLGEYLEEYLTPGGEFYNPYANFYNWEPGTDYGYTNIGAALIAYLVEVLSEESFSEYCENNIFLPLDMLETAWFLADLNISNIAVPYAWNGEDYVPYPHYCINAYPAGGLRTSVTQLRNFLLMMMNSGVYNSSQILQESTVDLILSTQVPFFPVQGLLWYKYFIDGRTLWGHRGGFRGCKTKMFFEPMTNIGVIILTNREQDYDEILSALFYFAENKAPDAPSIDGPADGKPMVKYDFNFVTSDPEEHNISYYIEWGDGSSSDWTDFVTSGTEITLTHKWSKQGVYIVKVKARDSYDAESDWSEFEVTIPRNRATPNSLLSWFLNGFPLLERLLSLLL